MALQLSASNFQTAAITTITGPRISNVQITNNSYTVLDDTAVDLTGGFVRISGTGFVTGCQVLVDLASATSVTFVSATEVRAQLPARTAGTYNIYVINPNGDTAIRIFGVTYSASPTWVTDTTLTAGVVDVPISLQLSATGATVYSLQAGSTLPAGLTLSSGGLLSGTVTGVSVETIYNFTIIATDAELQDSPRAFSFTISVGDPVFASTTLLLPGSATTFVRDASTNNFPVTVVGDTRPSTFNPYLTGWSNFFDGTGDFLTLPTNAALGPTSGDYTWEAWLYPTGSINSKVIYASSQSSGSLVIGVGNSTANRLTVFRNGVAFDFIGTTDMSVYLNRWVHVAVTKQSGTTRFWIDGVNTDTFTTNHTYVAGGTAASIGRRVSVSEDYSGNISNMRLVNGTAVYTANFTPPTAPLTAIAGTSLLTCQSNRLLDASTNNFAVTRNGDVTVDSFSPFVEPVTTNGSAYFDGTGDYVSVSNSGTTFTLDGDFTIEAWVYGTFPIGTTGVTIIDTRSALTASDWSLGVYGNLSGQGAAVNNGLGFIYNGVVLGTNNAVIPNQWNHVAVSRSGTTLRMFINGVQGFSGTVSGTITKGANANALIGMGADGATYGNTSYISNLRFVKGTALYTAAFTPPTAPLTAVANTSLLTLQNNQPTNNSMFLDSSTENFLITRAGNTTQGSFSPYSPSGWSNFFDGSTGYLSFPANSAMAMGTGDYTIEFWIYLNNTADFTVVDNQGSGGNMQISRISGALYHASATPWTYTFTSRVWTHIAFSRSGTNLRLFANGVLQQTVTNSSSIGSAANTNTIGVRNDLFYPLNGYISNLRVVRGTALYTGAFTPSTQPLTAIAGTVLLTCADNRFIDDSPNNFALTRNGDVRVQNFSPFRAQTQTPTTYSAFFDGSGDYLTLTSSTLIGSTQTTFTIEGWLYMTANPATGTGNSPSMFGDMTATSDTNFLSMGPVGTNPYYFGFYWWDGSQKSVRGDTVLALNTWYHLAVSVSSNTIRLFVNGVLQTLTGTTTLTNRGGNNGTYSIGIYNNTVTITGYISNLRVVNNTAVYTATFTPPTAPLTAISNTGLLTCQSPTFVDNSTNRFTINAFGNSQPNMVNPFGFTFANSTGYSAANHGGSLYFDGTGDSLSTALAYLPTAAGIAFTLELWVYSTRSASIQSRITNSGNMEFNIDGTNPGQLRFDLPTGQVNVLNSGSARVIPFSWNHIVLTRTTGNAYTLYLNGVNVGTGSSGTGINSVTAVVPGTIQGYVSGYRSIIGTVLYSSNFVPPIAPVQPVPNTVLLLNGTAAAITDATTKNVVETVGDARISTVISRTGGSSISFDGNGDRLIIPDNPTINLGTADFTLECWAYFNVVNTEMTIISKGWQSSSAFASYLIYMTSGASLRFLASSSGGAWDIANERVIGTASAGTWTHIAVTRSGTTFRAFVNGVINNSFTFTSSSALANIAAQTLFIGSANNGGSQFNGYIQDLRITNGVARYTTSFTPSATPFLPR